MEKVSKGKSKIRLLVSDMDGTLLNSGHEISTENIAALRAFVLAGGLFTIATGRSLEGVRPFLKDLPVNLPVILVNGALIYDFTKEEVVWETFLEQDPQALLDEILQGYPGIGMEIFTRAGVFVVAENSFTLAHRKKEQLIPGIHAPSDVPKPWYKIILAWEHAYLQQLKQRLSEKYAEWRMVFSEASFLDIASKQHSKGNALKILSEQCNIQLSDIAAVGDNYNDVELLSTAGLGFAVANAPAAIQEKAAYITVSHNEHAIASVIHFIKINT